MSHRERERSSSPVRIFADLPVKAAQGHFEPWVRELSAEQGLSLAVESDAGGNLPDIRIEFRFGAPLDMALEKPDNSKPCHEQRQQNRYPAEKKEAEFERSSFHGFCVSIM